MPLAPEDDKEFLRSKNPEGKRSAVQFLVRGKGLWGSRESASLFFCPLASEDDKEFLLLQNVRGKINYAFMKMRMFMAVAAALFALSAGAQNIADIDKNFAVEKIGNSKVAYRDAFEAPFVLEGFPFAEKGKMPRRMPASIKNGGVGGGVIKLADYAAGGVVRFRTNAKVIALRASLLNTVFNMGYMPSTSTSGFDLFCGNAKHIKTVNPQHYKNEIPDPLVAPLAHNPSGEFRDYTLYLPLFNGVKKLEIGVDLSAKFEPPTPHKVSKPIVFYGSSITHGACASRTSLCYPALVCRAVDAPMVNLGFSGNAKGEPKMAELIASLDMSVFVFDYDYNAPNAAHLKKTHERFFKIIRAARPDLPIIILTRVTRGSDERAGVIKKTYDNAVKAGDKRVYFLDGRKMFEGVDIALLTLDGTHPNDHGFYLMYKAVLPLVKKALADSKEK